jgi:hypothetical protein
VARGEDVDIAELLRVNEALYKFMPAARPAERENIKDALEVMWNAIHRQSFRR